MNKIKKTFINSAIVVSAFLPLIGAKCDHPSGNFKNYKEFKQVINPLLKKQDLWWGVDQDALNKEVAAINQIATNNPSELTYGNDNSPLASPATNYVPQISQKASTDQFTGDYLIARQLITFKFNDTAINDKIGYKYIAIDETSSGNVYLTIQIFDKQYPKFYTEVKLPINNVYTYGINHNHMAFTKYIEGGLTISEAYKYNVDLNGNYIKQYQKSNNQRGRLVTNNNDYKGLNGF